MKRICVALAVMIGLAGCTKAEVPQAPEAASAPAATPAASQTADPADAPAATPEPAENRAQIYAMIEQYNAETGNDIVAIYEADAEAPEVTAFYGWLRDNGYSIGTALLDQAGHATPAADGTPEIVIKACTPEVGTEGKLVAGYMDWYYAELEQRQAAETEESSAKGDGLGGTEVIGGTEFLLDSDGGGTAGDTYYTPEQLERVREAEARRPQLEKKAAERSARMEEVGRELHEFYQSEECQQFYRELLKIKQAHDAG